MIKHRVLIRLQTPWEGQSFETDHIGSINYLVGPNGSGKSRFASQLRDVLKSQSGHVRLLGTDRLSGMEQVRPPANLFGDPTSEGFCQESFFEIQASWCNGFRYRHGRSP